MIQAAIGMADLLLHTGLSSFQDDDFDAEHHLFEEWFEVGGATAAAVNAASRVIAVGTTVVHALESASSADGLVEQASARRLRPHPVAAALSGTMAGRCEAVIT